MLLVVHVVALVLALASGSARAAEGCGAPPPLADGWPVGAPDALALDPTLACGIAARLAASPEANAHGVVVVRRGTLVYEAYFGGPDQRWPQRHWREPLVETPHDAATKHDVQSITKSVVALLVGIALDRGLLGLDRPVLSYFPSYGDLRTAEKDGITVRHLLTMTSGLDWPQKPYLAMARQVDAAADPYRVVLAQPLAAPPGTRFRYNNGSVEVVGGVLQQAVGMPLDRFAREALLAPLGIEDWEWGAMANGDPGASWGLRLRPRDLAKLGQLVLNRGNWAGRQVVSAAWIDEMVAPQIERRRGAYGYLWWLGAETIEGRDVQVINASGWGGQSLTLVPSLGLVVVVTAGVYDFEGQGKQNLAIDTVVNAVLRAAGRS